MYQSPIRGGVRRSSAAGIVQRPPLPPTATTIGTRSHSLDGLLDAVAPVHGRRQQQQQEQQQPQPYGDCSEGTSENKTKLPPIHGSDDDTIDGVQERGSGGSAAATNKSHRRSRSMEDLIDDNNGQILKPQILPPQTGCEDRSKSLEHLTNNSNNEKAASSAAAVAPVVECESMMSIGSASSLNLPVTGEQPCGSETITIDNAIVIIDPLPPLPVPGKNVASVAATDDDNHSRSPSAYSRQDSTTSSKDSSGDKKKTFLNRFGKKVKSFIKK